MDGVVCRAVWDSPRLRTESIAANPGIAERRLLSWRAGRHHENRRSPRLRISPVDLARDARSSRFFARYINRNSPVSFFASVDF